MMSAFPMVLAMVCIVFVNLIFIGLCGGFAFGAIAIENGEPLWAGFCVFLLLILIMDLCLFCKFKDFKTAIAVIDASADFYAATKRLIFVNFGFGLIKELILAITAFGCLYLVGLNKVTTLSITNTQNKEEFQKAIEWSPYTLVLIGFVAIG